MGSVPGVFPAPAYRTSGRIQTENYGFKVFAVLSALLNGFSGSFYSTVRSDRHSRLAFLWPYNLLSDKVLRITVYSCANAHAGPTVGPRPSLADGNPHATQTFPSPRTPPPPLRAYVQGMTQRRPALCGRAGASGRGFRETPTKRARHSPKKVSGKQAPAHARPPAHQRQGIGGKRSQGSQRGTTLAHVSRKADRAYIAMGASGIVAHRITLSAWKRRAGGMVRPRVCAVLRLMTNSNFIGCSTGRSAGFAPFRILSTYVAARRQRL